MSVLKVHPSLPQDNVWEHGSVPRGCSRGCGRGTGNVELNGYRLLDGNQPAQESSSRLGTWGPHTAHLAPAAHHLLPAPLAGALLTAGAWPDLPSVGAVVWGGSPGPLPGHHRQTPELPTQGTQSCFLHNPVSRMRASSRASSWTSPGLLWETEAGLTPEGRSPTGTFPYTVRCVLTTGFLCYLSRSFTYDCWWNRCLGRETRIRHAPGSNTQIPNTDARAWTACMPVPTSGTPNRGFRSEANLQLFHCFRSFSLAS